MQQMWNGFQMEPLTVSGHSGRVVYPRPGTENGYLAFKTEYGDAFPEAVELSLLEHGFHLCYLDRVYDRWGSPEEMALKAEFVRYVTERWSLQQKVILIGMSCGGISAIKLATDHPEMVSCLYLDAPVLNYLSCPCGLGSGRPLDQGSGIPEVLDALHLEQSWQLMGYRDMPLDRLPALVSHRIPAVLVAGDSDHVVPFRENGAYLCQAYEQAGIDLLVRIKPGCDHHPHGLPDNREAVEFLLSHVLGK